MQNAHNLVDKEEVFEEQDKLYQFPYHYIPHIGENNVGSVQRYLRWGMEYLYLQHHMKKTVEALNPKSVLDVGCGDGAMIGNIHSAIHRVGVDLSERAIRFAKAFHPDMDFRCIDVHEVQEQFDVVTSTEVMEHIPDDEIPRFVEGMVNRTKPGGYIYVTVPSTNLPLNKKHYRHYDIALLERQLELEKYQLKPVKVQYGYVNPWWEKYYQRLCNNRIFSGEIKPLRNMLWKYVLQHGDKVDEKTGYHVIGLYQKQR